MNKSLVYVILTLFFIDPLKDEYGEIKIKIVSAALINDKMTYLLSKKKSIA